MFSDPTVFVIGAGASAEFNIAVGDSLKLRIADLLNLYFEGGYLTRGDDQIVEALKRFAQLRTGRRELTGEHFRAARLISDAMPHALSIDNFVDAHRGNEDVAVCSKLGIVKSILMEESRSRLAGLKDPVSAFDFSAIGDTWVVRLFQMITENVSIAELESVFDNLTLIIFNYDRCVEAYLPRALQSYYGLSTGDAEKLLCKLSIIHPYGVAGELDDQGRLSVPFGSESVDLIDTARNIRTFSEGVGDPDLLSRIRTSLDGAHTLVFLGFSFHPLNLELLEANPGDLRRIFATTYGLSKSAVDSVEQHLLHMYDKVDPTQPLLQEDYRQLDELAMENTTAYGFCSQYFRSLSTTRPLNAQNSSDRLTVIAH